MTSLISTKNRTFANAYVTFDGKFEENMILYTFDAFLGHIHNLTHFAELSIHIQFPWKYENIQSGFSWDQTFAIIYIFDVRFERFYPFTPLVSSLAFYGAF